MSKEHKALRFSVIASGIFAFVGLLMGVVSKSQIILFDGIYSLMSLGLSLGAFWIFKQVNEPLNDKFPFGKAHFEPIFVLIKNFILIGICSVSIINGFYEFFNPSGGPNSEMGLSYALFSFMGCFLIYKNLLNRNVESDLMKTEANQWRGDTYLSAGVLLGFVIMFFIPIAYQGYVDSGLVIISGLLFIGFPYKSIKESVKELLLIYFQDSKSTELDAYVYKFAEDHNATAKIRRVKIGRTLLLELNFQTKQNSISVDQMDQIREKAKRIYRDCFEVWVNVNFTKLEDEI